MQPLGSGFCSFFQALPPEVQACIADKLNNPRDLNSLRTTSKAMQANGDFANRVFGLEKQELFESIGLDENEIHTVAIELQKFKISLKNEFHGKNRDKLDKWVVALMHELTEESRRQEIQLINSCNFSIEGEREKNDKARRLTRCIFQCKALILKKNVWME